MRKFIIGGLNVGYAAPNKGADIDYDNTDSGLIATTVQDAIDEIAGGASFNTLTGTLTAGSTSITLSDASITTSSIIDVYTDLDVPYNTISVSTGSITLTFDEQETNMTVKVRVS